jgi:hypothetical protein
VPLRKNNDARCDRQKALRFLGAILRMRGLRRAEHESKRRETRLKAAQIRLDTALKAAQSNAKHNCDTVSTAKRGAKRDGDAANTKKYG